MAWTNLSAAFGYGTKLTSSQMQQLRDNITALAQGATGAPEITATYDGANLKALSVSGAKVAANAITADKIADGEVGQSEIADSSVGQGELKTSTGSVTLALSGTASASLETLPGGAYGFYPRIAVADALSRLDTIEAKIYYSETAGAVSAAAFIYLALTSSYTGSVESITASQRYVTASGEVFWIFILTDKKTGKTVSMWQAPDHPCFGNGVRPEKLTQPFGNYDPEQHNLYIVNPDESELAEIFKYTVDGDGIQIKDPLDVIKSFYEIDHKENARPNFPDTPILIGFRGVSSDGAILAYMGNFKHKTIEHIKRPMVKPAGAIVTKLRPRGIKEI